MDYWFTEDDDGDPDYQLIGLPAGSVMLERAIRPTGGHPFVPYSGAYTAVFKLSGDQWCRPSGDVVATDRLRYPMVLVFHPDVDVRAGDRVATLAGAADDLHALATSVDAGPQFRAGLDLAGARLGHCANARQDEEFERLEFVILSDAVAVDPSPRTPHTEFMRQMGMRGDE